MQADEYNSNQNIFSHGVRVLSSDEIAKLERQNNRLISEVKAFKLEQDAQKNWDLFYKRNKTKFFKDRNWTTREFQELINFDPFNKLTLLELGCGVGNLVFPLIEERFDNFYFYACDFSPRAVDFVKSNPLYCESRIKAFQCDITTQSLFANINENSVDIITMVFVLSAIHPDKFIVCLDNAFKALKPGGMLLFRDYGRYDMAQMRFKPGHKISDNFYMRQDGTRSYYFTEKQMQDLCSSVGYKIIFNSYIQRRTINKKEGVDVPRIFIQGKYKKP